MLLLCSLAEALEIEHRVADSTYSLISQHLDAALTAVYELLQYSLLLQSSHFQGSALLATSSDRFNVEQVQHDILKRMQHEWQMVLRFEAATGSSAIIAKHCAYTAWQVYRETMTFAECEGFALTEKFKDYLRAWHPSIQGSCNVEDVFADLQDSIQRSGKADSGSMSNLTAVSIRSVGRKCEQAGIESPHLRSADYEGTCVRSLKSSVFRPDSCPGSDLPAIHLLKCLRIAWSGTPVAFGLVFLQEDTFK